MKRALAAFALAACGHHPAAQPPAVEPDAGATAVETGEDGGAGTEEERTAAIEQAMNAFFDPLAHACWGKAAVDDYQLAGELQLLVTVDQTGEATAEVHADTVKDQTLTDCILEALHLYTWADVMHGSEFLLPFSFSAPHGQFLVDRDLMPEVASGARVLLDAKNSGNGDASMFELVVDGDVAATASSRDEVWVDLGSLGATYRPARSARQPGKGRYLILAVPGGTEDATRTTGVLPAEPAKLKDRKRPKPVDAGMAGAWSGPRAGVGTVTILVEDSRVKGAAMSTSILAIDKDAKIPEHAHDTSDEYLYLVSGAGTFVIDGVELQVTASSVLQIPKGTKHSFTASEPCTAIQFYTPAGPEQRFKQK